MAYLNSCAELDDLGKGKFRSIHHLRPVAYLDNGVYRLSSSTVAAYSDGVYSHAVLAANLGVRIGNDGRYAVHPTRELGRYVAFGQPQVKIAGKWTAVPFENPVRKDQSVIWTRAQADLMLTHIGHGLKHEMRLKDGYVPESNLIAFPVDLVGLAWDAWTLTADGVPVARFQSPVVYDAANREDTRPIKVEFALRDGQRYAVYTLPDLTGMTSPVIDPTLTLQPDAAAGVDTWTVENSPTISSANNTTIGVLATAGSRRISLVQFDLSGLPVGATTVSASLTLTNAAQIVGAGANATIHRILAANTGWIEGCTWNFADGGGVTDRWAGDAGADGGADAGCSVSGTDYAAASMGTIPFDDRAQNVAFDAAVLDATEFGSMWAANYGMVFVGGDASIRRVYASDEATAGYRPKLVIDYTVGGGGGLLLLGVG